MPRAAESLTYSNALLLHPSCSQPRSAVFRCLDGTALLPKDGEKAGSGLAGPLSLRVIPLRILVLSAAVSPLPSSGASLV